MTSEAPQSSLCRIRDNQRRSRARRKEYVQHLEARIREFERRGAQASHELQMAARTVASENARLRALLDSHRIPCDEINSGQNKATDVHKRLEKPMLPTSNETVGKEKAGELAGEVCAPPRNLNDLEESFGGNLGQDMTSCESAARIIASLKESGDIAAIRAGFGCSQNAHCMVANAAIFDQLDQSIS